MRMAQDRFREQTKGLFYFSRLNQFSSKSLATEQGTPKSGKNTEMAGLSLWMNKVKHPESDKLGDQR